MEKQKVLVYDVEENPKHLHEWLLFALQQVLAILVALFKFSISGGMRFTLPPS